MQFPGLRSSILSGSKNDTQLRDSTIVIELNKKAFNSRLTNPKTTIEVADKALKLAKKINYLPGIAEAYRVSGVGFSHLENNAMATKNYIDALAYYRQIKDRKNIARTYSNIGNLHKYNDPDKALKYFNKALKIAGTIDSQELLAGLYFNVALTYSRKSEYKQALINFDKSYAIFSKLKDTVSMVIYWQNTGRLYHRIHRTDLAKARLNKAIQSAKALNLYTTLSGCYLSLTYIYLEESEFKLAAETIAEGLKYARKAQNPVLDNDFNRVNYELELKQKNYQKALQYLSVIYHNDSLLLNQNQSSNIDINSQHYLQQQKLQEKELVITRQKYEAATTKLIITLGIVGILLSVIAGLIWHFQREKRRKREELIIQNKITSLEQKALQAMMNPHFVFNVMNSIQHFMNQADAKTANQVLSGFARLIRKHLEICMSSTISLHEELAYLKLYLSLEKFRFSNKMNYEIVIDKNTDTEEIIVPSMLIQPFVENAIWHGIMPKDEGGIIVLNFDVVESDLLVTIVDDGVGILNSEKQKKTRHVSRGMALIRERIELLNKLSGRRILIDQHQTGKSGTKVIIQIPI